MIPTTLLGIALFIASLGPGYVWVRVAEVRQPRHQRTQLLEAAELLFTGSAFSVAAFALVFLAAVEFDIVNQRELVSERGSYFVLHPWRGLGPPLLGLSLAYLSAYVGARFAYRGSTRSIQHGYSAWHWAMRERPDRHIFATVDLRDGSSVAGCVYQFTVGEVPIAERELVLARSGDIPIRLRHATDDTFRPMEDRLLLLQGADVRAIAIKHIPRSSTRQRRDGRLRRVLRRARS